MQRLYNLQSNMVDKFENKYRIPTTRASWWDYNRDGIYFITICTQGRVSFFGQIENNKMNLSGIGEIAENLWYDIPNHMPFVKLHAMVVMPNHIHGIIETLPVVPVETLHATSPSTKYATTMPLVKALHATPLQTSVQIRKETLHATSLPVPLSKCEVKKTISPKKGSLGSIIRSYKSAVSKQSHIYYPNFGWQERYYEIIIRDEHAFLQIES